MLRSIVVLGLMLFLFSSCEQKKSGGSSSKGLLPKAKGAPGEIIMAIDSGTYAGVVGDQIKDAFLSPVPWLPREESWFTLRKIRPVQLNKVLRSSKNLLYVTVLNDNSQGNRILRRNFTEESIQRIKNDRSIFMFSKEDEFARGQKVLHLFGLDEESLAAKIAENKESIRSFFNEAARERVRSELLGGKTETGIEKTINRKFGCEISVPFGYDIAIEEEGFIWVRLFGQKVDKNFFITYSDYYSEEQFDKRNIIGLRDSIAKEHIYGDPKDKNSYMVTDSVNFPAFYEEVNFNGDFGVKVRGLWKTNDLTMGGPFISYSIVDESQRRFYYIEGFLYSPGTSQREFMRELQVILQSFTTAENLQTSS